MQSLLGSAKATSSITYPAAAGAKFKEDAIDDADDRRRRIAVATRRPGSTRRHIAEIVEMTEASPGRLIDRRQADGGLERRELESDRRPARAVFLTEAAMLYNNMASVPSVLLPIVVDCRR